MLYTKNGDDGKTTIFGCNQRLSKSSAVAEALGVLDEVNSYLGIIKGTILSNNKIQNVDPVSVSSDLVHQIQENLFIIQAEIAGAPKNIGEEKVKELETLIAKIEKEIPPIKFFIISGATEMSAMFDFARTLARRAERRVVEVKEEGLVKIGDETLAYLNRLSSTLFAMSRQSAHESGINESNPNYR